MLESARLEAGQTEVDPEGSHHKESEGFECEWVKSMGVDYASCTEASMYAYLERDMGPGDYVIIPGFTNMARSKPSLDMGVSPVIGDVGGMMALWEHRRLGCVQFNLYELITSGSGLPVFRYPYGTVVQRPGVRIPGISPARRRRSVRHTNRQ